MAGNWTCTRCGTENEAAYVACPVCANAVQLPPTGTAAVPTASAAAPWMPSRKRQILDDILYNFGGGRSLALLAVFIVIGALVLFSQLSRDANGTIDKPGDLKAIDLRLGDCFDLPGGSGRPFENAHGIPCDQPHHFEVFYKGVMPNSAAWPTDEAIRDWAATYCQPAFEPYVGRPAAESTLAVSVFYPAETSWNDGERLAQCSLSDGADSPLTTSVKGSGR